VIGSRRPAGRLSLLLAAALLSQPVLAEWQLDWWTIDGGGEIEAQGGSWTLSGTIGQWDANAGSALTGDDRELAGGFWQDEAPAPEVEDRIFSDRFDG